MKNMINREENVYDMVSYIMDNVMNTMRQNYHEFPIVILLY